MSDKYPFTFGRMVVDLRHQFFGHLNPSVFIIADPAADEEAGDEDVWTDHTRGHVHIPFKDLHDASSYKVLGFVDNTSPVYEQIQIAEKEFAQTDECKVLVRAYDEKYHPERLSNV